VIYQPTPVVPIHHKVFEKAGINVLIKREDLNHPLISGNKWWKLKYNLQKAAELKHDTLLTFGGAFSNHIFATAVAAVEYGFKSVGIIRGERATPLNPTLAFAESKGMQLHFISREQYRLKSNDSFIAGLEEKFGRFYLLPEGGANSLALKGCAEFASDELLQHEFDHAILPVGTGGTIAGIIGGLDGTKKITGVTVLKNGEFLIDEIASNLNGYFGKKFDHWNLLTQYHHGGYAKSSQALENFMNEMDSLFDLPLDHVYSAKMLWALFREAEAGGFSRGVTVLAIHTGGYRRGL
jgi:1-aminocyclopropane-1-carboxylate deaminase